jgi:hypothetical protein
MHFQKGTCDLTEGGRQVGKKGCRIRDKKILILSAV